MQFYIGNVRVSFSVWFFAVISLFAVTNDSGLAPYFAAPVILHELSHFVVLVACGGKVKAVRFTAFGIDIEKYGEPALCYAKEIAVSVAGSAANLTACLVLYFFVFHSMRAMLLSASNLAVALFNLMPIGSLDGGELMSLLSGRFFAPRLAFVLSRAFSFAALVPLFAAAIFLLMRPERNFTLLAICCYLLINIILKTD